MRNIPLASRLCGSFMKEIAGSLIRSIMNPRRSGDFRIVSKVYGTRAVTDAAGTQ
jgi:hypothetical protein